MTAAEPDEDRGEAPEKDALLGTRLAGKYDLLEVLGEGAMGRIYRAKQAELDRQIAIKVLHKHLGGEDRVARRFHREARAASRLSHPNSVQILDFGSENGVLFIAMELLEGEDLQTILDHDGAMSPAKVAAVLVPVLRAVDEAHRAGIVHRDLKPENVIVWSDRGGREHVKVCDFGIAKILDGEGNSITVDGFVCGTPQYMAPEQARGDTIDHRLDVYAAGVVLYQMLAGKVPFTGETALGIITRHLTDDPVPPSQRTTERHVPASLEDIALKAMSKPPEERYQTAGEMADALARAVAELGDDASRPLTDPALARYARPRTRRDATADPMRKDESGRRSTGRTRTEEGEAATTELAAATAGGSRELTYGLVVLAAVGLVAVAYFWSRPDPPPAPATDSVTTEPAPEPEPGPETDPSPVPGITPPPLPTPEGEPVPEVEPGAARTGREHPPPARGTGPAESGSEAERPEPTPPSHPPEPTLAPGPAAFAEGRRLFLANDVTGAIARFEEAARLMPRDAEVQRQLGRAHMRAGNVAESVAAYRRYLELSPEAPDRTVVESIIARNGG
jgi:serine/threonine-protein kinase